MTDRICPECGCAFPLNDQGRARVFCSAACRIRDGNRRARLGIPAPARPPKWSPPAAVVRRCEVCEEAIPSSRRRFCSNRCLSRYHNGYVGEVEKVCPLCGVTFTGPQHRIYCSKRCARRVDGARARGSTPNPPVLGFVCAACSTSCVPGRDGVAFNATRFCGRPCKQRFYRPVEAERYRRLARRRVAEVRLARAAKGTRGRWVWVAGDCARCGVSFLARPTGGRWPERFCSPACGRRNAANEHDHRRRAQSRGGRVRRLYVFRRDGWTCQLCGRKVKRTAKVPDPLAPTIDHVIPLSVGGEHSEVNAQCAHYACNVAKSNRGDPEQLRLIG